MPEKIIFRTKEITETKTATEGDVEGVGTLRWVGDFLYRWVKNDEDAVLVVGQPVMYDATSTADLFESVVDSATGEAEDVAFMAGIAVSAIPTLGFGWILIDGIYEEAVVDEPGTATIAVGDILICSASADYLGEAVSIGTAATYPRHAVAMEAVATATAATATTTTARVLVKCR